MTEYSDVTREQLLVKVAEFGGSASKASRATGVPKRTLEGWWESLDAAEQKRYMSEARDRQEAWWQALHDECLIVARKKVGEMSARDALVGAGISFDKLALLRGQATDIVGTISADAESLAKAVDDVLSKVTVKATREAIDKSTPPE